MQVDLDENQKLFPVEVQEKYYILDLEEMFWRIHGVAREKLSDTVMNKKLTARELRAIQIKIASDTIQLELQLWKEKVDCFDYDTSKKFVENLSGKIHGLTTDVFKNWGLDNKSVGFLWELARLLISKSNFPSESDSGIVIAGFGEGEHFPVLQHIKIGGIYGNRLKFLPPTCKNNH